LIQPLKSAQQDDSCNFLKEFRHAVSATIKRIVRRHGSIGAKNKVTRMPPAARRIACVSIFGDLKCDFGRFHNGNIVELAKIIPQWRNAENEENQ